VCGHHEGYHNDAGECLLIRKCFCRGFDNEPAQPNRQESMNGTAVIVEELDEWSKLESKAISALALKEDERKIDLVGRPEAVSLLIFITPELILRLIAAARKPQSTGERK
jgi:hypothetical protein